MDLVTILSIVWIIEIIFFILARMIGPNMFIGIRLGFIVINRKTWNKTHEFAVGVSLISLISFWLLTTLSKNVILVSVSFISIAIITTIIIILRGLHYAEKITGFEPIKSKAIKPIAPIRDKTIIFSLILSYITCSIIMSMSFTVLPKTVMIRFDIYGNPVDVQEKTVFALSMLTISTVMMILGLAFYYIGTRYPIFFHTGALTKKWGRKGLYRVIMYSIVSSEIIISLAIIILTLYNKSLIDLLEFHLLTAAGVILAFLPLLIAYIQGKQEKESSIKSE